LPAAGAAAPTLNRRAVSLDVTDIRVIDESGDDYVYEANRFLPVELPEKTVRVLKRSFARSAVEAR